VLRDQGIDLQQVPGSGAGGGFAGGLHAFMNAELKRGTDVIFEITNFYEAVAWADVVITGEGRLDNQTLQGKLVHGVVGAVQKFGKPVYIICGESQLTADQVQSLNATAIFSLTNYAGMEAAMMQPAKTLSKMTELQVAQSIKKGDG
jgi:glycerate kinase